MSKPTRVSHTYASPVAGLTLDEILAVGMWGRAVVAADHDAGDPLTREFDRLLTFAERMDSGDGTGYAPDGGRARGPRVRAMSAAWEAVWADTEPLWRPAYDAGRSADFGAAREVLRNEAMRAALAEYGDVTGIPEPRDGAS